MEEKFIVGLIVSNHFGVLNRVAGLYGKRGYNIDSLAVGETEDPRFSRMTIVSTGGDYIKEQIVKQLNKLHDVKKAVLLDSKTAASVEHMLIKLKVNGRGNAEITALINAFGGKVADFGSNFITAEITGDSEKINSFIEQSQAFGILEVCRSGLIALAHGTENILNVQNFN